MTNNQDNAHGGSMIIASVGAVVLLIYFLFPAALIFPLVKIYGSKASMPPRLDYALGVAFTPVRYLALKCPPYRLLLAKESELTGIH